MFSVYGPGQALDNPYQGVLGIFMGKLLRGEKLTIFGDGKQTRDFVYIADIVDGWVKALHYEGGAGNVFNLGSGRSLSINDLAMHAIKAFGGDVTGSDIAYAPLRPGEQRTVQADISRAKTGLGWYPATPFEVGLAETMQRARIVFAAERPTEPETTA